MPIDITYVYALLLNTFHLCAIFFFTTGQRNMAVKGQTNELIATEVNKMCTVQVALDSRHHSERRLHDLTIGNKVA